ncbi:hypothetical protein Tco_0224241, partial [Tanacetum coccineum]
MPKEVNRMKNIPYASAVGSIMYAVRCTRPDVAFTAPMPNFKIDERILWIEVSCLPLCAWGSMAYKKIASSFGKFLFFEKEESTALSSGRLCISTKSHQLISETVQVDIKNESFEVSVKEIGSCSSKIKDDYNDISSNHDLKEVDHVSESNDEQPIDDFEIL